MKNAMSKRVIALVMMGSIMGTTVAQAAEVKKDESVYVTLGSTGNLEKTTVSDWLHSEESGITVFDKSELKNIKNVKSDVEPEKNGENLIWDMDGNNIYYQGTTNKDIPLDVSIKYYYEDEEIEPEDLAGKSGKVRIEIDVKNKEYKEVDINGKMRKIYTPFIVAGEITLPNDKFKDVSTEGATTISEGNNILVAFAKMPGLSESLELDSIPFDKADEFKDKADILNDKKIVVEADAEEFSLGPIMMTATADTSMLGDLGGAADLTELKDKLDLMQSSYNQILEGETQINDGIVEGYAEAKRKIADAAPRAQGMLSLIQDQDKVDRSNQLLKDAYYAQKMDTKSLKGMLDKAGTEEFNKSFNAADNLLNKLKQMQEHNQIQQLKSLQKQYAAMKDNGQLEKLLSNYNILLEMQRDGKIKTLKDEYMLIKELDRTGQLKKFVDGYSSLNSMKKSGELDKLLNGGKVLLNNYDNINGELQEVSGLLNNKELMTKVDKLINDIHNMESLYGHLTPETKKVVKILSSNVNKENLNAIINMTETLTPAQQQLKEAIDAAGGIDNFVTVLRSSLSTIGSLSQVDFSSIKTDVSSYGSAYLVLRGELMASAISGKLEDKKIELKNSVAAVYSSSPELVSQLQGAIDSFSSNLTPQAIQKDCENAQKNSATLESLGKAAVTLQTAAPLLNQLNSMTSNEAQLKAVLGILAGNNEIMTNLKQLATMLKSLPEDQQQALLTMVSNLGNMMDTIDSNIETINKIKALAGKYLSPEEIEKINKYSAQLNEAKGMVDKLKSINFSSSDIPDIDVSKLYIPTNIDESIFDINLPPIDKSLLEAIGGIEIPDGNVDINKVQLLLKDKDKLITMSKDLLDIQERLRKDDDILGIMSNAIQQDNVNLIKSTINELPDTKEKLDKLNSGIQQLSDGMKQFKDEAIDELHNKGTEGFNAIDELSLAKDEIINASKEYGCFSGQDESVKGTTKFIMKTKEIKYEAPKEDDKNTETTEKKGFFAWIKSLLGID